MKLHTEGTFHLWRTGAAWTTSSWMLLQENSSEWIFAGDPRLTPKPCSSTQKFRLWAATHFWGWQSPSLLFCQHYYFEESPSETLLFKLVEKMWCVQQWVGPVLCNFCMVWKSVHLEWKSLEQGGAHYMENHQVWPFALTSSPYTKSDFRKAHTLMSTFSTFWI